MSSLSDYVWKEVEIVDNTTAPQALFLKRCRCLIHLCAKHRAWHTQTVNKCARKEAREGRD